MSRAPGALMKTDLPDRFSHPLSRAAVCKAQGAQVGQALGNPFRMERIP